MMVRRLIAAVPALLLSTAALAQVPATQAAPGAGPQPGQRLIVDVTGGISQPMPIAIPAMPTPGLDQDRRRRRPTRWASRWRRSSPTTSRVRGCSSRCRPATTVSYPQVTAPDYDYWTTTGASALVQGFVQANGDGTLTVGCYLYDVFAKTELARQGFVVPPAQWRRAAHKCADTVYTRLTGEGPYFDSRVVYVSETGPKNHRIKRLAVMDQDGANHRFLTNGQSIVLTPRFAPNQQTIVYMSFTGNRPRIYTYNIGTGTQKLVVDSPNMTLRAALLAGRALDRLFDVDRRQHQIYRVSASGGAPTRLTNAPGIDTGALLFARRQQDRVRERPLGRRSRST